MQQYVEVALGSPMAVCWLLTHHPCDWQGRKSLLMSAVHLLLTPSSTTSVLTLTKAAQGMCHPQTTFRLSPLSVPPKATETLSCNCTPLDQGLPPYILSPSICEQCPAPLPPSQTPQVLTLVMAILLRYVIKEDVPYDSFDPENAEQRSLAIHQLSADVGKGRSTSERTYDKVGTGGGATGSGCAGGAQSLNEGIKH